MRAYFWVDVTGLKWWLSIFHGYFAAVSILTLFDGNNGSSWIQSMYGAERAYSGDAEIRGGIAGHFF